jgi:hypothetical protein
VGELGRTLPRERASEFIQNFAATLSSYVIFFNLQSKIGDARLLMRVAL